MSCGWLLTLGHGASFGMLGCVLHRRFTKASFQDKASAAVDVPACVQNVDSALQPNYLTCSVKPGTIIYKARRVQLVSQADIRMLSRIDYTPI